ncbi:MAG: hypothetical protein ACLFTH_00090 [Candidatus Woesearchaeota archaeon]
MSWRKAQSEIIGLVIIVLIVSMAMLIYLSSQAEKAEDDQGANLQKEYAYNELAMSFLDTLVDTSVCNVDVDKLVRDCGSQQEIVCNDGMTSCEKLNQTIVKIKNKTLDVWDYPYGLIIHYPENNQEDFKYIYQNCTNETTGRSAPGWIPISLHPRGTAMIELGICEP